MAFNFDHLSSWQTIIDVTSSISASVGAAQRWFSWGDNLAAPGNAGQFVKQFPLPTDSIGVSGMTCQLRIIGSVHTNATAPTGTFTFGIQTIGPTGGGAGVNSWGATGSPVDTVAIASPGATTMTRGVSTGATFAGSNSSPYAIYVTNSATTAASSYTGLHCLVQIRYV